MSTLQEGKKINGFSKFDIEDAARTLIRAKEIRRSPKLFKLAVTELKRQVTAANEALNEK